MTQRPNYIVFAPDFDPDSGGSIFLHQLVHALRELGEDATLWYWLRQLPGLSQTTWELLRRPSLLWKKPQMKLDLTLNSAVSGPSDLRRDTIVVYPEVTLNNPLRAGNVVRWLLYTPGVKDAYSFGTNEMFFRVGEICDLPELTGGAPDLFVWRINPAYRNLHRSDRKGACFIVRKGSEKPRLPETADAIQIDGMSHQAIADVFNRCEVFYSYDEATLYSQYAALCGCLSVVVPGLYPSRAEWVASHELARYGVAYGLDDLDHARATQHLVQGQLQAQEERGLDTVRNMVALTQARFGRG